MGAGAIPPPFVSRKDRTMKLDTAPAVLSVVLLGTAFPASAVESVDKQRRQAALEHYREGERHMRSEKWDVAEREFKAAIVQDPLLTLAHYSLGQTYMATRRYPDAVSAF